MYRRDDSWVLRAVEAVVGGDPLALRVIASIDHADLRSAVPSAHEPLLLTRAAVVAVLKGLFADAWTPEQVQAWASFVRRGYIAGRSGPPIRALDIAYEDAFEEAIATAVSRLDEIGDLVDGEVSSGEIVDLLQLLGERWPGQMAPPSA